MSSNNKTPTVSLIISTYNWPKALKLVIESAINQSYLPNEIIIADDGSSAETQNLIKRFQETSKTKIEHVWHEDNGFRLSEIRNKAIAKSKYEYIIQIDGDTILNKNFIKDHINLSEKYKFITASRVLLSQELSKNILENGLKKITPLSAGITNRLNTIHLPIINKYINKKNTPINKLIYKVRGCNMAFWKKDLLDVNGYNEDIKGWGKEDSEITLRLLKKGLALKKIKFSAIQYHLFHKEAKRDKVAENQLLLEKSISSINSKTKNGILKL